MITKFSLSTPVCSSVSPPHLHWHTLKYTEKLLSIWQSVPDTRIHFSFILVVVTHGMVCDTIIWSLCDLYRDVTTSPIWKSQYDNFVPWKIHSKWRYPANWKYSFMQHSLKRACSYSPLWHLKFPWKPLLNLLWSICLTWPCSVCEITAHK